jgi:uncharacterized protein
MSFIVNLGLGLLFGLGLVVSGMANPAKVLNFLDLFGTWDPSLAFVMGGAVIVAFFGYRVVLKRDEPVVGETFHLPTSKDFDRRLVVGSTIFGAGWGVSGFCPGPAITALTFGEFGTLVFVPAMIVGMWVARLMSDGGLSPSTARG